MRILVCVTMLRIRGWGVTTIIFSSSSHFFFFLSVDFPHICTPCKGRRKRNFFFFFFPSFVKVRQNVLLIWKGSTRFFRKDFQETWFFFSRIFFLSSKQKKKKKNNFFTTCQKTERGNLLKIEGNFFNLHEKNISYYFRRFISFVYTR